MEQPRLNSACNRALLGGLTLCLILGATPVSPIELFSPAELFAQNGTTTMLTCTFKSKEVVSSSVTVTWSFRAEGSDMPVTVFYYGSGNPYFVDIPQFKDRVLWAGDLNKKDVSIQLLQTQFKDNGTYICDVKNPPDVSSIASRTELKVVLKEALPQTNTVVIVGAVVGAVIGLVLITVVTYLIIRRQENRPVYEGCTSIESVSSQAARPVKKAESSTEGSRCSSPSAPLQGPVIYAQLDHSGTKNPNSVHKKDRVVYADIRKN